MSSSKPDTGEGEETRPRRAVRDVYVDGMRVVADGRAVNIDYEAAAEALEEAQKRSMAGVPRLDWAGRTTDQLAPMVLPISES